jgi:hypothetical protein
MEPPDSAPELRDPPQYASSPESEAGQSEPGPAAGVGPDVETAQTVAMQPPGPAPDGPSRAERQITAAFLIELVGGLLGLLGLGYLYAGRTSDGLVRLVVWLIVVPAMWTVIAMLMAAVVGCCIAPFGVLIQIFVPIWSALTLKADLERQLI